ncbi:MAG: alpha/beta hydrolase fold domain-containing protein [Flavobacteriaceae bacterium]
MTDDSLETLCDRQILRALRLNEAAPVSDITRMSPQATREAYAVGRAPWNEGGPAMKASERGEYSTAEDAIAFVRHVPEDATGVLVYLHGGGWVTGSTETHDGIMRRIAEASHRTVVGLDYPLAPESRRERTLRLLSEVCDRIFEAESGRIAFGGDSAGAELALSLALLRRDAGKRMPDRLALLYPALWPDFDTDSYRLRGEGDFGLSEARMRAYFGHYLGEGGEALDTEPDCRGLPDTLILGAALDCLLDDAFEIARQLADANVPLLMQVVPGAPHGFLHYSLASRLARRANRDIGRFLRLAVGR